MCPKNSVFIKFLQVSGIVEMFVALMFFTFPLFDESLGIELGIPLFYLFSAISFFCLGFLLWYAAKDPIRYRIIIYVSCGFRFLMIVPELSTMIVYPQFFAILLTGWIYDWSSSILTLIFLQNFLNFDKKDSSKSDILQITP